MQSTLNDLFENVSKIKEKFQLENKKNGELFNVFSVLNQRSRELSHSLFLSELLNCEGSHGQNDLFFKLFIEQISVIFPVFSSKFEALNFNTQKSKSQTEISIGNKSNLRDTSGRIDILISDLKNNIIIENKIYATDQDQQLLRYHKFDKQALLIYLTLFKDSKPNEYSIRDNQNILIENKDFFCVSYEKEIKSWIVSCIEVTQHIPTLNIILKQYLKLINELTGQSNNLKMSKEIIDSILLSQESFKASELIVQHFHLAKAKMWHEFATVLTTQLEDKLQNVRIELDEDFGFKWKGIRIFKNGESRCVCLTFRSNFNDCYIEIHPGWDKKTHKNKEEHIYNQLQEKINSSEISNKFKIQKIDVFDNSKGWQGEWVGLYDALNNVDELIYDKNEELINFVVEDLKYIYDIYNSIN